MSHTSVNSIDSSIHTNALFIMCKCGMKVECVIGALDVLAHSLTAEIAVENVESARRECQAYLSSPDSSIKRELEYRIPR